MNFQNTLKEIEGMAKDPTTRWTLLVILLIPVAIIYFFKIKLWKPKKTYRRARRRYRSYRRKRRR